MDKQLTKVVDQLYDLELKQNSDDKVDFDEYEKSIGDILSNYFAGNTNKDWVETLLEIDGLLVERIEREVKIKLNKKDC